MKNFLLFLFVSVLFIACKSTGTAVKTGTAAYEQKKFVKAVELLNQEAESAKDNFEKVEKLKLLANSYNAMNNPQGEVSTYKRITEISDDPYSYLQLGLAQKHNEEYEDALASIKKYKELSNDVFNTSSEIKLLEEILEKQNSKEQNILIKNLGNLNTAAGEYAPRMFKNNQLSFTSTRTTNVGEKVQPWDGQKNPDIYVAEYNNGNWNNATNIDAPINTDLAEGVMAFTSNFETAYFTRCDYLDLGKSFCRIYKAEADGQYWYEPELVEIFSDSANVGQPYVSPDNKRLYFSSDAPYGYGEQDIYYIDINNGTYSQPINAGYYVNTEKNDLFPTVDKQGNLYFATNGRKGYGGLDIFKATPDKNSYAQAELLPFPINTGADDFSLQFIDLPNTDKNKILETGVFSSTRKGGKGNDDLYMYQKLFINYYELHLTVVEKNYENPNDANSKILGLKPLENAIVLMKGQEKITPQNGKLVFELETNQDYKLYINKVDYFNKSLNISTKGLSSKDSLTIKLYEQVELEKIFPEKEIVIPNIYYDYDKATLRAESLPVLDKLVSFFQENNDLTIEIGSHTDSRGSDKYNEDLSQRRAQSVVDYLIEKGVPTTQLQAKGYGESRLINECKNGVQCSEEKHQENRRTTFRVITKDGVIESGK